MMVAKRASLRNTEARSGLALMNNPDEWINKDGVKATELEKKYFGIINFIQKHLKNGYIWNYDRKLYREMPLLKTL